MTLVFGCRGCSSYRLSPAGVQKRYVPTIPPQKTNSIRRQVCLEVQTSANFPPRNNQRESWCECTKWLAALMHLSHPKTDRRRAYSGHQRERTLSSIARVVSCYRECCPLRARDCVISMVLSLMLLNTRRDSHSATICLWISAGCIDCMIAIPQHILKAISSGGRDNSNRLAAECPFAWRNYSSLARFTRQCQPAWNCRPHQSGCVGGSWTLSLWHSPV
ncbi:hypothetical protein BCR34DRAFT_332658 [Clohesyomyces aquaticus]|uniref:Uncharacterized protein n=1 Tax=Clohesyomyces aquaticus TaxID=1231657 RepID=A0A1Y1ZLE8_9PLEO|nr:hypothetical protein BCR34DRAFT_332658 [Clohesyomyces aquaticus]